jgi:hypothetical protein
MKYLVLIYDNEQNLAAMTQAEREEMHAAYVAFTREAHDSGRYVAGEALQRTTTASTVRVRGGQVHTTDGPFAETREQLGGFYLIDAANLDEALAFAARVPSARSGSIEVRPCVVFGPEMPTTPVPERAAAAAAV